MKDRDVGYYLFLADRYALALGVAGVAAVLSVPWFNPRSYRRFAAALIDLGIGLVCYFGWMMLSSVVYSLGRFPPIMILALVLILRDTLTVPTGDACGSIGKRLMHVRVWNHQGGGIPPLESRLLRNITFLVVAVLALWRTPIAHYAYPALALIELILAWLMPSGRRLGDLIAGTQVQYGWLHDIEERQIEV